MRSLHPLAVASIEAWLATLPEKVRADDRYGNWWRTDHVIGGVAGAVDLIRCNTTCGWHFDDCGPSLVRMLRRAALLDIAERESTELEGESLYAAMARRELQLIHCRRGHATGLSVSQRLTRRRRAAMRLLMLDERAMDREGATYSDAGWATATLPAGSGAVMAKVDWSVRV